MASSKAIKNAIVDLLTPLTLDGEAAFVSVKGHPRGEFDGFPAVRVLPADMPNEKAAFSQNDRTVSLIVRTHVATTEDGSEFDYVYDLTDLILNALDESDFNNTFRDDIGTYVLDASRGDWYDGNTATGPVLICDISVAVKYSKDL